MTLKLYVIEHRKKGRGAWRAIWMQNSKKAGLGELRWSKEHHIDCDTSQYRLSTYQRVEEETKP